MKQAYSSRRVYFSVSLRSPFFVLSVQAIVPIKMLGIEVCLPGSET